MLRDTLPDDLPCIFISAVTGKGLDDLKDILWKELNSESNKLAEITSEDTLVHRDKNIDTLAAEVLANDSESVEIDVVDAEDIDDSDLEIVDLEDEDE